jgi:glutathione S-transferase
MRLYGTTTSPFVRRVRVVAAEAGAALELELTSSDAGQAALRRVSPIWKVPVLELGDPHRILFDSRAIIDWLTTQYGFGRLCPPRDRWLAQNHLNACDGALESAIAVFYLRREGVPVDGLPYADKQRDRATAIFDWLDAEQRAGRFGRELGVPELSLCCTLAWMEFRDAYPVAQLGDRFAALRARFDEWASMRDTAPRA